MGDYINPSNDGFLETLNTGNYRDKTGLISYINSVLETEEYEICFTRPRRFGKTTACDMLAAYYSSGCRSRDLFRGLEIERDPTFEEHLNKHPVIYFDLLSMMGDFTDDNPENLGLKKYMNTILSAKVAEKYPEANVNKQGSLKNAMLAVSNYLRKQQTEDGNNKSHKFIVIIDEWDMVLREAKDKPAMVKDYIDFLRSIFRSKETPVYLAGAYMTGILPIIRCNSHSALSDFKEYTMLKPLALAKYVGFTQEDVHAVCMECGADESLIKDWYDGYSIQGVGEVYCPFSVMEAARNNDYSSHWTMTASMEALTDYIYADLDGLAKAMNDLLDGMSVSIDADSFENRLDQVDTRDKTLTVLVHLGYLAYDNYSQTVRIPNLEVRLQMLNAFKKSTNKEFFKRVERCEKILAAVKDMDGETVAEVLKEIHDERPPIHYNDEQALRYVVLMGFNNSPRLRFVSFEELSSGKGFADILFKPQKGTGEIPMLVELKYGASTNKAINQIEDKDYIAHLKKDEYHGDVLLVGINYSSATEKHTCRIDRITI